MKRINQHRMTGALALILCGCFFLSIGVQAQSLKVNINVNSTVGMQPISSFELIPEEGSDAATPGLSTSPRLVSAIGGFAITGKENTDILIRLDAPKQLINKENQAMPFKMDLAWENNNATDPRNLNWTGSRDNILKLSRSHGVKPSKQASDDDLQAFVYLKSTAEIPANSGSPFEGDIHVTIEY